MNCSIGLRTNGRVYEACLRSALLYGAETWALTNRLKDAHYGIHEVMKGKGLVYDDAFDTFIRKLNADHNMLGRRN